MVALGLILGLVLSAWGGALVARVIANRLEHGTRRWRLRNHPARVPVPPVAPPPKRSLGWSLLGVAALALGSLSGWIGAYTSMIIVVGSRERDARLHALITATAVVGVGLSAGLLVVGLRFDPARGRRRCPACWYDMSAVAARRCPECGHEPTSERALYRSRRSRATIALASVPLIASLFLPLVPNVVRFGPIGLIPTTLLIACWERLPSYYITPGLGPAAEGASRTASRPPPSGIGNGSGTGIAAPRWHDEAATPEWSCTPWITAPATTSNRCGRNWPSSSSTA